MRTISEHIRRSSLILCIFFLPINLNLNNIFLFVFIVLTFISAFVKPIQLNRGLVTKHLDILLIASMPFWLNTLGLIYSDEPKQGLDYLIRALPFLFLPIIAIIDPDIFSKNYKKLGNALVSGCLVAAFYSWAYSIIEIWQLKKPIAELFGPLYSHHNLVKSLDLHAAYLSIFIYTSLSFLIIEFRNLTKKRKALVAAIIVILTLFMFHLLSRNALLYFIFSSILYMIYLKKWKILTLGLIATTTLLFLANNVKHNYLRDRIFNSLNFFEKETQFSKKDDRFDRLVASYEIFKQKPIIGYGTAAESKHRREIFLKNKDIVAYNQNYNAHNQFFEYLSTYGIIGGIAYLVFFVYLFKLCLKQKNIYFLFLVIGLFGACLTESIFERSNGVVYTSILVAIVLSFKTHRRRIEIDAS